MKRPALLVALILVVGIAGSIVALSSRSANPQFLTEQRDAAPPTAGALQELVERTSDPRPGYSGRARSASCTSTEGETLGNPWLCVVRYPRPPEVSYTITVRSNGSITGTGQPVSGRLLGELKISGCCLSDVR